MNENDWRAGLRMKLEEFVDTYVAAGAKPDDIFSAILEGIEQLSAALERDPDPAEDEILTARDKPANNRPGADGR
jgi:hypothetical protein